MEFTQRKSSIVTFFEWLVASGRPISLVEDKLLVKIIEKLGGKLLKRTQMMKNYLLDLLNTVAKVQNDLVGITYYSITSDGWTTSLNKSIHWSSTTIHWIDQNGTLKSRLLDIGDVGKSTTADVIKQLWNAQLEKWRLNPENLVACVVDGGANNKAASKRQAINIHCLCHRVHLVVKDVPCHPDVTELYKNCKKLAANINKRISLAQDLEQTIKSPSSTRWNSAHFASLLVNKEFIHNNSADLPVYLTSNSWLMISFLESLFNIQRRFYDF